jgi:hypothetical protein
MSTADSIAALKELLEKKRSDAERMHRMLEAVNEVDSLYKLRYPTWIVLEEDMRERIRRTFRVRKIDFPPDGEVRVVANPDTREILEITIGDATMGRNDASTFMSDSLQNAILDGNYVRQTVDPRPQERRVGEIYGVQPRFASVYASAFGAGLLFSNAWGAEAKMGFEEVGYHFWSTGSLRALAVFDQFKIGVLFPIANGADQNDVQPLDIRPRKMTGSIGFGSEFTYPFETESLTAMLSIGDLARVTNDRFLTDSTEIYFMHTVGQLTYSKKFDLSIGHVLTATAGIGYHQVSHAFVQPDKSVHTVDKEDFISPVLRVEYLNRVSNMFGASIQYYSSIIHLKGWVEMIRNLLYLDLQYYSPIIRDAKLPVLVCALPALAVLYVIILIGEVNEGPLRTLYAAEIRKFGFKAGFRRFMQNIFVPSYKNHTQSFVLGAAGFLVTAVGLRGLGVIALEWVYVALGIEFMLLTLWALTMYFAPEEKMEEDGLTNGAKEAKAEVPGLTSKELVESVRELSTHIAFLERRLAVTESKFEGLGKLDSAMQTLSTRLNLLVSDQFNIRVRKEFEQLLSEMAKRSTEEKDQPDQPRP